MKRKTAAILVGMMVSVSLTAGCGSNEATEAASQGEQTGAEDEEETEEASKEEEEETAATGEAEEGEEDNQEESSETQEPEEEEKGTVAVLLPDDTDERWAADGGYIRTELENAGYELLVGNGVVLQAVGHNVVYVLDEHYVGIDVVKVLYERAVPSGAE